ncbi:variant surface antigen A-like [Haliotis cracherodii]|uniref:variant surface antigen A-like n=1 Tax=Haliotis cracherodii TaxID=6455 RepID=UPI0039EC4F6A
MIRVVCSLPADDTLSGQREVYHVRRQFLKLVLSSWSKMGCNGSKSTQTQSSTGQQPTSDAKQEQTTEEQTNNSAGDQPATETNTDHTDNTDTNTEQTTTEQTQENTGGQSEQTANQETTEQEA